MLPTQQARLVAHGALVFLLGLAAGFPFAFEILGRVELWPIPGSAAFDPPGDVRGWRMAHLEGILNGMLLIAVGSYGDRLRLSARATAWLCGGLLVCAWGNVIASWMGPLTQSRGLVFAGFAWETVVFLIFMAAIVGVCIAMVAVFRGARAAQRSAPAGRVVSAAATVRVTRLYSGADGESHFEDLDVPLAETGPSGRLSELVPARGVIFRETPADYHYGWHNAPRRQYVVLLSGGALEIEVGDGSVRRLEPGSILLAEDTTGRGHISRAAEKRPRISLFIPLD